MRAATRLALCVLMSTTPIPADAQRATKEPALLIVGLLRVQSSYASNFEAPADGRPDTIQWFIGPGQTWRVRTYAAIRQPCCGVMAGAIRKIADAMKADRDGIFIEVSGQVWRTFQLPRQQTLSN